MLIVLKLNMHYFRKKMIWAFFRILCGPIRDADLNGCALILEITVAQWHLNVRSALENTKAS